jgi:probable rRNA maturation factor
MRFRTGHTIYLKDEQDIMRISVRMRMLVKRAIAAALWQEGYRGSAEVSVTFTDDEAIRELNKQFRDKDTSTDVLSFPMDEDDTLGDIVISVEHAIAQAEEYGHPLEREIAFLTVHSVLHLLGWDHERSEDEEKAMFLRQEEILSGIGLGKEKFRR